MSSGSRCSRTSAAVRRATRCAARWRWGCSCSATSPPSSTPRAPAEEERAAMPDYYPFHPDPRPPSAPLPALACDSQFHVFGPPERYPVRPGAAYEMPSADIERALALHATLGLQRGVIVQATTYGADHRVVLD